MSRMELEEYTEELTDSLSSAKIHMQSRDLIIEGAHAQLIMQGRAKLFPEGKGRHLTDEAFAQELERVEQEKQGKEAEKDKRKALRARMW
ncbi:hypothetical protein BDR05DRAFT_959161 [Suillus weaverae]|nr:hypothetical protein BDR05DRAFT_959161 [Suillus weaverae]